MGLSITTIRMSDRAGGALVKRKFRIASTIQRATRSVLTPKIPELIAGIAIEVVLAFSTLESVELMT